MDERVSRVVCASGYRASVMMGNTSPPAASPLAGNKASFTENSTNSSEPMMNEGMEMNAVVITMMALSMNLLRRSAATEPSTTPMPSAEKAAMTPSLAETFIPSLMMSMTWRPRCFRDGPKSSFVTISFR